MRLIKDVLIIILFVAIIVLIVRREQNEYIRVALQGQNSMADEYPIVAFGDSLVKGFGVAQDKNFVSLLENRLNVPIYNAGIIGDTTERALLRLERDVLSHNPDIVLVLLGGNDVIHFIPREETFTNLATILSRIRQQGAEPILIGVRGGIFIDRYEGYFE